MNRFTASLGVLALFAAPVLAQPAAPDSAPLYLSKDELASRLVPDKGGLYAQAFLSRHDNTVVMVTTRDKSGEARCIRTSTTLFSSRKAKPASPWAAP